MRFNLSGFSLFFALLAAEIGSGPLFAQPGTRPIIVLPHPLPNRLPDFPGTPTSGPFSAQGGVWRFHGLAGKCLDVGGYPLGHSNPVILYDCNGTSAQDITLVPFGNPQIGYQYELRAHGRCLTVGANAPETLAVSRTTTRGGAGSNVFHPSMAGAPILLEPCNNNALQRFYVGDRIYSTSDLTLVATVQNGNSANRTPLVLEAPQNNNPAQDWSLRQFDTTPWTFTSTQATAGSYGFVGYGSKCIDVGGEPHPENSPIFLYGCNGTLAQQFAIKLVDDHLGTYNITAFGKCFDVGGSPLKPGIALELNTCSGNSSQLFSFDNFDHQYIYPSGFPELAVGARGPATDNHTPLELQWRTPAAYQNWQPVEVDVLAVGPGAPAIHIDKSKVNNAYVPAIAVQVNSSLAQGYAAYWRKIEDSGGFVGETLSMSGVQKGQSRTVAFPEIAGLGVYLLKVRATDTNGLFSESPTILVDGRQLEQPDVSIVQVQSNQVTVGWKSVGTPQANGFNVSLWKGNTSTHVDKTAAPQHGDGLSDINYSANVGGLQPSTQYSAYVNVTRDLWPGIGSSKVDVMTMPQSTTGSTPSTITIWMQESGVVEGYVPYAGHFGPIYSGATITKVNFPVQFPPVLLVKPGHSTNDCGTAADVVEVQGDMTAAQEQAIWGTSTLKISGTQELNFVGCGTSPTGQIATMLPVNITFTTP